MYTLQHLILFVITISNCPQRDTMNTIGGIYITKVCRKCGNEYPATEEYYYPFHMSKDKLYFVCISCCTQQSQTFKASCEKKQRESAKVWRKANRAYFKQWFQAHPEVQIIARQRRIARKRALPATLTRLQWAAIKAAFNNACCYCGNTEHIAQDHYMPVSKGGEYTHNNIVPACQSCNCSRGNKDAIQWFREQPFYTHKQEQKILKYLRYKDNIQQLRIYI